MITALIDHYMPGGVDDFYMAALIIVVMICIGVILWGLKYGEL